LIENIHRWVPKSMHSQGGKRKRNFLLGVTGASASGKWKPRLYIP